MGFGHIIVYYLILSTSGSARHELLYIGYFANTFRDVVRSHNLRFTAPYVNLVLKIFKFNAHWLDSISKYSGTRISGHSLSLCNVAEDQESNTAATISGSWVTERIVSLANHLRRSRWLYQTTTVTLISSVLLSTKHTHRGGWTMLSIVWV